MRTVVAMLVLMSLTVGGFWPAAAQEPAGSRPAPSPAAAPEIVSGPGSSAEFKAGEVLVKLKGEAPSVAEANMPDQYGARRVRVLESGDVELWQVPVGDELTMARQLSADPRVEYAEPNYRYYAFAVPNDPGFNRQWAHTLINSVDAWDITTGSPSLIIASLDSGIDENHPDLQAKIVPGYDFVDQDANPHDLHGHGTHVAGVAAASTHNGIGIAGVDWQARIMPVRVLDAEGGGWASDIADGIQWAFRNGARVLSLSLGGSLNSQTMQDAVNAAHTAGSLVVAAMGNCRTYDPIDCPSVNPIMYPAGYDKVMAVAATGPTDLYAPYSQYGPHCDIAAPGGDMGFLHDSDGVYSTMPTYPVYMTTVYGYYTDYDYAHGTSQAAPYVAGLAALVWAADPALSADQVQNVIKSTAKDLGAPGWDPDYGHGRIDALAALQEVAIPGTPTLLPIQNSGGNDTYLVDWNDVSNADSYTLQEDNHFDFSSPTVRYAGPESQFMVTGQGAGNWYYRVRASSVKGESAWSNIQSTAVAPGAPVLNAIGNTGGEDEYEISWSASAGAAGYRLEEADNPSFSAPRTRYVGMARQYGVTGQPGGTWYYRVRGYNSAGDGLWSNAQSTVVNPASLDSPKLLAINNADGDGAYVVGWMAVTGATSYLLEESRDPYFGDPTEVYAGVASEFPVADQPGGRWHYRVRALGPAGVSPWSNERSTTVTAKVYVPWIAHNHATGEPEGGVQNGDFESGRGEAWTEFSKNGSTIIRRTPNFPGYVWPRSGSWAAWLGGNHLEDSYIEQQVTVPGGKPYLTFWHWIDSSDICWAGLHLDYVTVEIDGVVADLYDLCTPRNTGGWARHTIDLSDHEGHSVSLRIRVRTDSSLISNLFVDDVVFQATPASGSSGESIPDADNAAVGSGDGAARIVQGKQDTH
ncbi:S8 family serine peptidase [Chloroflexota bacterium]